MYSASRSHRAETRNRTKEDLKRVIYSVERVRKWEKKWVVLKDTTIRIMKWVPVTAQKNITAPPKLIKSVDDETSNTMPSTDDVSQDNTDTRTGTLPSRLTFGNGNEDSNTGFGSEHGFDSDSNQTFEPQYKANAAASGSLDFSAMREAEMKK